MPTNVPTKATRIKLIVDTFGNTNGFDVKRYDSKKIQSDIIQLRKDLKLGDDKEWKEIGTFVGAFYYLSGVLAALKAPTK